MNIKMGEDYKVCESVLISLDISVTC